MDDGRELPCSLPLIPRSDHPEGGERVTAVRETSSRNRVAGPRRKDVSRVNSQADAKPAGQGSSWLGRLSRVACHRDRKSTRLNSSHVSLSYAAVCLKRKSRQPRVD